MAEKLGSGHVVTDEDVDTARLIIDLDRALGRTTDPLTRRVAETPPDRARSLIAEYDRVNGQDVPAADTLARALTSPKQTAELAAEVAQELPADMDPAEQARVTKRIERRLARRLRALVTGADPGAGRGR